jgi:hypothetical protein
MATLKNILIKLGISLKTAPAIDRNIPIPIDKRKSGNKTNGVRKQNP